MHEIMNDNAMFSVGDLPWHKLGKVLDIPPSTEEALELAELNWKVHKQETYIHHPHTRINIQKTHNPPPQPPYNPLVPLKPNLRAITASIIDLISGLGV